MPPTLYLVRHAEGEHNVNCAHLRRNFTGIDKISIVMASPLKRTMQTAAYCFGAAISRPDVSFLLVPLAQEVAANPCDTGFSRAELAAALPDMVPPGDLPFDLGKLDFELVEQGRNSKSGLYRPSFPAVEQRAAELRKWLRARPEESIVLVSHGAFLHYLIDDWAGFDPKKGTGFCNCEVRRYGFAGDGSLVSLDGEASREGHVKVGRPVLVNRDVLVDGDGEDVKRIR